MTEGDTGCPNLNPHNKKVLPHCPECKQTVHSKPSEHRVSSSAKELVDSNPSNGPRTCPQHDSRQLDLFCVEHHVLCCQECVSEKSSEHSGCKTLRFDDKDNFEVIKRDLAANLTELEKKVASLIDIMLPNLRKKQDEVEENVHAVRDEIDNVFAEIRKALDAREEALLRSLEEVLETTSFDSVIEKINESDDALSAIKAQLDAVNLGKERDDPGYKMGVIQQECAVHTELYAISKLEEQAHLALKNAPKVIFDKNVDVLMGIAGIGDLRIVRGPQNIAGKSEWWDSIALSWDDEGLFHYEVEMRKEGPDENPDCLKVYEGEEKECVIGDLVPDATYVFRVRKRGIGEAEYSPWSDEVAVKTSGPCWKECPADIDDNKEYVVFGCDSRKASFIGGDGSLKSWCTIVGSMFLPLKRLVSWSVEILSLGKNDGGGTLVGVAPSDIDQNFGDNTFKCGWYFDCYTSTLCSGPPHEYWYKEYGGRNRAGTWDIVGVVMDTSKGELSFSLNGVNLGVAFEGIPLDKPLVPCVLLHYRGDSVELKA